MTRILKSTAQQPEENAYADPISSNSHSPSIEETRRFLRSFPIEIPEGFRGRIDKSDLVQDVLLKISENQYNLGTMEPPQRRVFLGKMLSTRIADIIRTHLSLKRDVRREKRLEKDVEGTDSTPSSELIAQENQDALATAMQQLPMDYQNVLHLRHKEGLTFVQIGVAMNRSPDAVRVLWGRAILRLTSSINQ
jgi:RNA polymerase sigma-70 factor (ECF subfamily)